MNLSKLYNVVLLLLVGLVIVFCTNLITRAVETGMHEPSHIFPDHVLVKGGVVALGGVWANDYRAGSGDIGATVCQEITVVGGGLQMFCWEDGLLISIN